MSCHIQDHDDAYLADFLQDCYLRNLPACINIQRSDGHSADSHILSYQILPDAVFTLFCYASLVLMR